MTLIFDRRRQRRVDRQCTPTNMAPLGAPRNSRLSYHLENSMDAIVPDRDEASALAALEAVVNVDFLKSTPGRFTNGSGESGPTRIIRTYLGEPEDTWVEQKARYANGNISPGNHSCIEIDGDDDDTEKLEPGTLPPDTMVAGTLGEGSGSYSEFTNSGDMSCPSDLEI